MCTVYSGVYYTLWCKLGVSHVRSVYKQLVTSLCGQQQHLLGRVGGGGPTDVY